MSSATAVPSCKGCDGARVPSRGSLGSCFCRCGSSGSYNFSSVSQQPFVVLHVHWPPLRSWPPSQFQEWPPPWLSAKGHPLQFQAKNVLLLLYSMIVPRPLVIAFLFHLLVLELAESWWCHPLVFLPFPWFGGMGLVAADVFLTYT